MISAVLAAFMLAGAGIVVRAGDSDITVQSYEDQLGEIARKKEAALAQIDAVRNSRDNETSEAYALDELIRLNTQQKKLVEAQLDSIGRQIEEKNARIEETRQKMEAQEQAFLSRMTAHYMEEDVDWIELIFGSVSLVDFLTRLDSVNAIMKRDKEITAQLDENRRILESEEKALEEALQLQKSRVSDYESTIRETQAAYDAKLEYIESLKYDEAAWLAEYSRNREMEDALNAELEEYLAELARKEAAKAYVGGEGGWPLEHGVWYKITSEQGWRTLDGIADNHYGIDIAAPCGTPILAYNSGTVVISENHWSYGEYITIDHGGGVTTLYAHMSERLYSVGDYVEAGTVIGYVGLTGNTRGYHLHFETREYGSVVNPRNYLVFPTEFQYY